MNENGNGSVLELIVMHWWKRKRPKMETLAFKVFKTLPKSNQLVRNALKLVSRSQNKKNPEEWRRTMQKKKYGSLLKFPTLTNWSIGWGSINRLVNAVNDFDFPIFAHFFILWSPYPFQLNSPIFYAQCQGNFDFWSKIDHYISICLYEAYDMKFMQS